LSKFIACIHLSSASSTNPLLDNNATAPCTNIRDLSDLSTEKILSDNFTYSALYYEVGAYLINPKLKGVVIRSVGDSIDFYNASIAK